MPATGAWKPSRRQVLTGAVVGAAAVALPAWPAYAEAPAAAADTAPPGPVLDVHPAREPSGTHIRTIDGADVLFSYGAVVPAFDGWRQRERGREYAMLDGGWRFSFDPTDAGTRGGWASPGFNDRHWASMQVPSSWDLLDPQAFAAPDASSVGRGPAYTDGYAWYRRWVVLDGHWRSKSVRLHSLGAGYSAEVWIDGIHIGKHEGAASAFAMPLPDAVARPGRHLIAIRVHRRASYLDYQAGTGPVTDDYEIPYKPVDYWPYAGLTRSLWLEGVAPVAIAKVLVAPDGDDVRLDAVIENRSDETWRGTLRVTELPGEPMRVAVPPKSAIVVRQRASAAGLARWTPAHPSMLTLVTTLVDRRGRESDSLTTRYGLRSVDTVPAGVKVEGELVFLKGMNWHEETIERGRSMTVPDLDAELQHVLDLGCGFIRNSVYGRHPHVYDWADEHGVLVMDDLETMWLNTAQEALQTNTYGLSAAMAATAAWNHHNHPSVVLWGLQNESEIDAGGAPVYRAWLQQMKDAIRRIDRHSRPVTWASSTSNDPAFDIADVVGFNEYFGYFYGATSDLGPTVDAVHAAHPNKPILITENGAWAIAGTHGDAATQGTEEWQADYLAEHWAQVAARQDFVTGYTAWVLKDYKQRGGYNQSLGGVSVMGLLTFDGRQAKAAYARFRDLEP